MNESNLVKLAECFKLIKIDVMVGDKSHQTPRHALSYAKFGHKQPMRFLYNGCIAVVVPEFFDDLVNPNLVLFEDAFKPNRVISLTKREGIGKHLDKVLRGLRALHIPSLEDPIGKNIVANRGYGL